MVKDTCWEVSEAVVPDLPAWLNVPLKSQLLGHEAGGPGPTPLPGAAEGRRSVHPKAAGEPALGTCALSSFYPPARQGVLPPLSKTASVFPPQFGVPAARPHSGSCASCTFLQPPLLGGHSLVPQESPTAGGSLQMPWAQSCIKEAAGKRGSRQ